MYTYFYPMCTWVRSHTPLYVPFTHVVCNIDEFIRYYRATFPEASITPKLHMLEDHVVPFIRQWRVGLGVMGEQGAESIHNRFNVLERTYSNMPDKVNQLKCMVADHFRQVCLANIVELPPAAKRAKREG